MSSASRSPEPPAPLGHLDRVEQLRLFDLGPADSERLRALRPTTERAIDGIVADFYVHLRSFPDMVAVLDAEPGRQERLMALQKRYVLSLLDGVFDDDYFTQRLQVGNAHQELHIRPEWYIGAFSQLLRLVLRANAVDADPAVGAALPTLEALAKAVFLDMALAMHTYIFGGYIRREVVNEMEAAARVAEEALALRAETERLKEDLTRMIVHDLKNPVNGIIMMVQLALRKDADLSASHRGHFKQIDRTCREMMRLIQNILEIAKLEEGKMPVECQPVVLAELTDEVLAEYQTVAEDGGRTIVSAVPVGLPPAAADRALLRRILVNLVVNALRHSGSREVRLVASVIDAGRTLELAVIDYGRGIPPEQQSRLFEKFGTVRRSPVEDPASDTGLGLPFCRLALDRMGGSIGVTSNPGRETSFAVRLPAWAGAGRP